MSTLWRGETLLSLVGAGYSDRASSLGDNEVVLMDRWVDMSMLRHIGEIRFA